MASLAVSVMFVFAPFRLGGRLGRTGEAALASRAGSNIAGGDRRRRWARYGFKTARDGRQQSGRLERLLQAADRAKPGRHGQEIRA
jgi:hypothetical protein